MERNCTTCIYVQATQAVDENKQPIIGKYAYHCHFSPPTALLMPTGPQTAQLVGAFPPVTEQSCCHQHMVEDEIEALPPPN